MSIWQFDLWMISKKELIEFFPRNPIKLSEEDYESKPFWMSYQPPSDHQETFSGLLDETSSWHPDVKWWGTEEGDRIDVLYINNRVKSINIRLNLITLNIKLIQGIADIAAKWDCIFLSCWNGLILNPSRHTILSHLFDAPISNEAWERLRGNNYSNMSFKKIFLCHSSKDRSIVDRLAKDLRTEDIPVWYDKWELKVGDSINEKIQEGIQESSYLAIILSISSVDSGWVKKELNAALAIELEKRNVYILPVLIEDCKIPVFLKDKIYADFRKSYEHGFQFLLNKLKTN